MYPKITPWQIPNFDLAAYDEALRALHSMMEGGTPLKVNSHRFLIIAQKVA